MADNKSKNKKREVLLEGEGEQKLLAGYNKQLDQQITDTSTPTPKYDSKNKYKGDKKVEEQYFREIVKDIIGETLAEELTVEEAVVTLDWDLAEDEIDEIAKEFKVKATTENDNEVSFTGKQKDLKKVIDFFAGDTKTAKDLYKTIEESAVGSKGRTSLADADAYLEENTEMVAEFKKIVKKMGGKSMAEACLKRMKMSNAKPPIEEGFGLDFKKSDKKAWEKQAKDMGLKVSKPSTDKDGEPNNHWYVAKDKQGNTKGEFDSKLGGSLTEEARTPIRDFSNIVNGGQLRKLWRSYVKNGDIEGLAELEKHFQWQDPGVKFGRGEIWDVAMSGIDKKEMGEYENLVNAERIAKLVEKTIPGLTIDPKNVKFNEDHRNHWTIKWLDKRGWDSIIIRDGTDKSMAKEILAEFE